MKVNKDIIRPIVLKVGVALSLSLATFLYSRFKSKSPKFSQLLDSMCPSDHFGTADVQGRTTMEKTPVSGSELSFSVDEHEDTFKPRVAADNPGNGSPKDGYLLQEFDEVVEEFSTSPKALKELETSSSNLETLQGFTSKEKQEYEQEIRYLRSMIGDLQEREKNLEFQLLEFYGLKEQESALIELQNSFELINTENKLFTRKIESLQEENHRLQEQLACQEKIVPELDAARAKIKLLTKMLKSEAKQNKLQILKLRERVIKLQEQENAGIDSDMKLTLEKLKNLEAEVEDLKKENFKLQQESNELAIKCESTSVLEDPVTKALQKLTNQLRQEKEELEKKVEQLQGAEKGMDFDSDQWSSSHDSYIIDSDELSVSSKDQISSKVKFFSKIQRLIRGKDVTDATSEMPFSKARSVSPYIRRSKNPKMDEKKDSEFGRSYSDIGSGSIYEHKRTFSHRITGRFMLSENLQVDQGCYASEKSELKKFAVDLKDSREFHRKSTSLGSLLGFHSSTSE